MASAKTAKPVNVHTSSHSNQHSCADRSLLYRKQPLTQFQEVCQPAECYRSLPTLNVSVSCLQKYYIGNSGIKKKKIKKVDKSNNNLSRKISLWSYILTTNVVKISPAQGDIIKVCFYSEILLKCTFGIFVF